MARKKDPMAINKREKAILKFIQKQVEENGYAPSVREIGKAVGLKSTATVHGYLAKLSEKGYDVTIAANPAVPAPGQNAAWAPGGRLHGRCWSSQMAYRDGMRSGGRKNQNPPMYRYYGPRCSLGWRRKTAVRHSDRERGRQGEKGFA